MIQERDYTLIIDKSGSMSTPDQAGGKSRWEIMQESTLALARKCEQFDPDGMTVYLFSGKFKRFDDVTSQKVAQIFMENDPAGTTNLAAVLKDATDDYFKRKERTKPTKDSRICSKHHFNAESCLIYDTVSIMFIIICNIISGPFQGFVNNGSYIITNDQNDIASDDLVIILVSLRKLWKHPVGCILINKTDAISLYCLLSQAL